MQRGTAERPSKNFLKRKFRLEQKKAAGKPIKIATKVLPKAIFNVKKVIFNKREYSILFSKLNEVKFLEKIFGKKAANNGIKKDKSTTAVTKKAEHAITYRVTLRSFLHLSVVLFINYFEITSIISFTTESSFVAS
ncbi:MAG: hypothetical protein MJ182_02030 [Treponema sp.]|nr:hypothetical protein [Treponema sp.]